MSSRQPETILVHNIVRTIKSLYPNCVVQKNHGSMYMATGIPDLFVFHEGRAYAFEVKRKRGNESEARARSRCTPIQRYNLQQLRRAGVPADCVISPAEAIAIMRGHAFFYNLEELPEIEEESFDEGVDIVEIDS